MKNHKKELFDSLEFNKVLNYIASYAQTESGKILILGLQPYIDSNFIKKEGSLASEAKEILIHSLVPPLNYIPDISSSISLTKVQGSVLEIKQILSILSLAKTSRFLVKFFSDNSNLAVGLKEISSSLFVSKNLETQIESIITEFGEVKDSASKKLKEIRNEIKHKKDELQRLVNKLIKSLSSNELIRDEYVTLREGRVVVPVKAEHKRHIKGFIHSESSSGQTVYIEPEETLNLNNEIVTLSFAENREIEKILRELTQKISENSDDLLKSLFIISEIDKYFAIAQYSIEIEGAFPSIDNKKPFTISTGRHPVLLKKLLKAATVPIDLRIDTERIIIVTGPNAGGKTVVLKTIGLLALMVQSGLHIPASPDSNFHLFEDIFIDIGDKQSIEDDLSTFSSHLSNLHRIIENSNEKSLILLDELGTGTEPSAGSALAIAVINTLREKKSLVFAATHLGALKLIANESDGIENASMEFNTSLLLPTYTFKQGIPGSSYAFEIARRIGFSKEFLDEAKLYLTPEQEKFDKSLIDLEDKTQKLDEKLKISEKENVRLEGLIALYNSKVSSLEKEKKIILKETKEAAEKLIREAKLTINSTIKELRETKASKETIRDSQKTLENLVVNTQKIYSEETKATNTFYEFKVGDTVRLTDTNSIGIISEFIKNKEYAFINSGSLKLKVRVSDLEPAKDERKREKFDQYSIIPQSVPGFRLDIRGKKPDEVEFELIKYIDSAYSENVNRVEILHGKGTGALKKMVKDVLLSHNGVKAFYFAPVEYGGEGITIVELK